MTTNEYKSAVIDLFQSGKATPEQWEAMAAAVLECSEQQSYITKIIDQDIEGADA